MRGWIVAAAILVIVILSLPAPLISCREVAMTFGASELELALGQAKSACSMPPLGSYSALNIMFKLIDSEILFGNYELEQIAD